MQDALARNPKPASFARIRGQRVAVISDALAERNGVGSYYRDLAVQLSGRGLQTEVLCPDGHTGRSLPMPCDPTQRLWLPPARELTAKLERLQPQVIVLPTPGPFGLYGLWAAKRLGARIIVGFHTHFEALASHYCRAPLDRAVRLGWRLFNTRVFRQAAGVVTTSRPMVAAAQALGAPHVHRLGTLLGPEFLATHTPNRDQLRSVLFAGRLAAEKNLEAVVQAARELPGVAFHIVGDGPQRDFILGQAAQLPNLHYHGWCSRSELLTHMDASDLLVLPSHVESFGTVVLEAMARARTTLISPHCGIAEWPALAADLAIMRPQESLADAISRLSRLDPRMRSRMAQAARRAALAMNEVAVGDWVNIIGGADDMQGADDSCAELTPAHERAMP